MSKVLEHGDMVKLTELTGLQSFSVLKVLNDKDYNPEAFKKVEKFFADKEAKKKFYIQNKEEIKKIIRLTNNLKSRNDRLDENNASNIEGLLNQIHIINTVTQKLNAKYNESFK